MKILRLLPLLVTLGSSLSVTAADGVCPLPADGVRHSICVGLPYDVALNFLKLHHNTGSVHDSPHAIAFPDDRPRVMHTATLKNGKDTVLIVGVAEKEGAPYVLEAIYYEPDAIPARPLKERAALIKMECYPSTMVPAGR